MNPEAYDAWYHTPRGAWIGDLEFHLLVDLLRARTGESLLDVGCGTGYFTRRLAREAGLRTTGIDPDPQSLAYARKQGEPGEVYLCGLAEQLPFADRSFECTVCITALCFIADERRALSEMLRVTRRRLVLGLLNRRSLLYLREGRAGGSGGYRGARWHTVREVRALLVDLAVRRPQIRSAVFLPTGSLLARTIELLAPSRWPLGGFLAIAVDQAS